MAFTMYFAGRLESGNVNEYFDLKLMFNKQGVVKYDDCLVDLAMKEKEYEMYILDKITSHKWTARFQFIFRWGADCSLNSLVLKQN